MNNLQNNLQYLFNDIDIKAWCLEHDMAYRTIQSIRHGTRTNAKIDTIISIAAAFNITLDELVLSDLSSKK